MLCVLKSSAVQDSAGEGSQSPYQWGSMQARTPLSLVRRHHWNLEALYTLEGGTEYGVRLGERKRVRDGEGGERGRSEVYG